MTRVFTHPDTIEYIAKDGKNFCEEAVSISMLTVEKELSVPYPNEFGLKVMYFVKKNDSITTDKFYQIWGEAHQLVMEKNENIAVNLCKYIQSIPQAANANNKHFKSENTTQYDGVASMWFTSIASFRLYQTELEKVNLDKNFMEPSYNFFLCCDEVKII